MSVLKIKLEDIVMNEETENVHNDENCVSDLCHNNNHAREASTNTTGHPEDLHLDHSSHHQQSTHDSLHIHIVNKPLKRESRDVSCGNVIDIIKAEPKWDAAFTLKSMGKDPYQYASVTTKCEKTESNTRNSEKILCSSQMVIPKKRSLILGQLSPVNDSHCDQKGIISQETSPNQRHCNVAVTELQDYMQRSSDSSEISVGQNCDTSSEHCDIDDALRRDSRPRHCAEDTRGAREQVKGSDAVNRPGQRCRKRRHGEAHKEFACNACSMKFPCRRDLKSHARTHTGEKPFQCEVCGMSFSVKSNMTKHERAQHGRERGKGGNVWVYDKVYKCHDCGIPFKAKGNLKRHLEIHDSDVVDRRDLHVCRECGDKFTREDALKRHQECHLSNTSCACAVCHATFTRKYSLSQHMRSHTGGGSHICRECGVTFSRRKLLKQHTCAFRDASSLVEIPNHPEKGPVRERLQLASVKKHVPDDKRGHCGRKGKSRARHDNQRVHHRIPKRSKVSGGPDLTLTPANAADVNRIDARGGAESGTESGAHFTAGVSARSRPSGVSSEEQDTPPDGASPAKPDPVPRRKKMARKRSRERRLPKARPVEWPCGVCGKDCQHDVICCDGCDQWQHFACVGLNDVMSEKLAADDCRWYCVNCE